MDNSSHDPNCLAPFNPISEQALQLVLDMIFQTHAETTRASDSPFIVFDLGCGDCRLLREVVKQCPDARCVGIDRDPKCIEKATIAALAYLDEEQQSRLDIRLGNALDALSLSPCLFGTTTSEAVLGVRCRSLTLQDATVVYLYLLPNGLLKLQPILDRLVHSPTRKLHLLISYTFRVRGLETQRVVRTLKGSVPVYLYIF